MYCLFTAHIHGHGKVQFNKSAIIWQNKASPGIIEMKKKCHSDDNFLDLEHYLLKQLVEFAPLYQTAAEIMLRLPTEFVFQFIYDRQASR